MMQLLQTLLADRETERAERQANIIALQNIANQGHGNHDHPGSKLKNFQNTNPPVFSKTEEPLDADDWLQTMENNLEVAGVEANEKVLFATHYLAGPARAWWTSTRAMNGGQFMTWEDFKLKFSKYHVPPGLIKKMRDEFRELKQGRMTVVEYRDKFLTLSRYAPDETDTVEKRKERFLNGLHDEMQTVLVNIPFADLEALVDSAIQMEGKLNQANENRKRRMANQRGYNNNNYNRAPPRAPNTNNTNTNTNPRTGSNAIPVANKQDKSTITCYECGVVGHYSNECPKRLAKLAGNTAAPAQQRRVSTGKKFAPNNPNNRNGRLYHMNAEEAQEAPDVVLGLEVVLGMDWMSKHNGLIDCAKKAITMTSSTGIVVEHVSEKLPRKFTCNQSVSKPTLDQIRVVCRYPDVFPDDLPGMPPDRDIEFIIELIPGTGPIAQRAYSMNAAELVELKKQIDDMLAKVFGPDVLREAEEKVHKIREYLKTAQSRQKSYADKRRREMTFEIGDFAYLKVSPLKGMQRFQLKGKLAPRYVGPFQVLSRRGEVSYQLELPEEMSAVHDVFHISLLRKCLEVPEKTEVFKNIDHRSVDINQDLTYREVPIRILEEAYRTTRTRSIKFLKIQWSNHTEDEATWEREDFMKKEYPDLFST
ncbi:hypothetical protein QYE76_047881 [Lolium multiflorum]|uniref:CCHC-type domain-containing protein n=1 Tax=Lolium multiflorum TaxID=4521 RepID=A0AAD8X2D2_LOLMU|nr:hypothetical protein QYE76_047881 [Lolium multiflorum]